MSFIPTFHFNTDPGGYVTKTKNTGTTTTQNKSADLSLVRAVSSDILDFKAKGIEFDASAAAQRASAAGYDAEIAAYGSAERTARQNALYSRVAGEIAEYQSQRDTLRLAGSQRAGLAGAGFVDSADMVRSTLQQGYLDRQLIRTQALFEEGGYLEQAAAGVAQAAAAGTAKTSALNLASTYDTAAADSRVYAANATTALSSYLSKFNLENTTADGLLSGADIGTEIATAPQIVERSDTGSSTETKKPINKVGFVSAGEMRRIREGKRMKDWI
ncbi:MAG: hypothetical protein AB7H90_03475 [Alphaproteobacteria bacterium]